MIEFIAILRSIRIYRYTYSDKFCFSIIIHFELKIKLNKYKMEINELLLQIAHENLYTEQCTCMHNTKL